MLGLFKRTKIEGWEIDLLGNTIKQLPAEYRHFEEQIDAGLLKRVLIGLSDLPGYVAFSYNTSVVNKFEDRKAISYKLTNILIFDVQSGKQLMYSIYVSSGMICGYAITGIQTFKVNVNQINVDNFKVEFHVNQDFEEIAKILTAKEKKLLNQDDVYKVVLQEKIYYHIKDLEDGDFIGMDKEKNNYKITHDPYEIVLLNCSLKEALEITD
jgi:hypothetical protein